MGAKVLHFGWDDCYRIPVLAGAGYVVTESKTLESLALDLQKPESVEAVFISEHDPRSAGRAGQVVRNFTQAPLILFGCSPSDELDELMFDQVFPWFVSPEVWLVEAAELIAKYRALREQPAFLRIESHVVCRELKRRVAYSLPERLPRRQSRPQEPKRPSPAGH